MLNDEQLLYADVTYKIRGACFAIWKEFGGAFKEKIIENALKEELERLELNLENQKRINIFIKIKKLGVMCQILL